MSEAHYLEAFRSEQASLGTQLPEWAMALRLSALSRFERAGFPDPRHEEWRYTNVRSIAKQAFKPTGDALAPLQVSVLDQHRLGVDSAVELVFVNGRLHAGLSQMHGLPEGVVVEDLSTALRNRGEALEPLLGQIANDRESSFVALSTAFLRDGVFVGLAPGCVLERPIKLLFVSTREAQPVVCHPRILFHGEANSQATVIEHYAGVEGSASFTNTVTELALESGARLEHYKIQRESTQAYHIGSLHVRQMRDSSLRSHNVNLGGRLVRNDLNIGLMEPGAEVLLNGLFMAGGRQHVDNHTRVHHAAPHTRSTEEYRGILDDHARGVFKGRVLVERGAQRIEAHQTSANLVLSDGAEVDTKPELEIYADDVVCSHGATVGQLDEQSLFYLRSRGLDDKTARGLLTFAFAGEVISRIGEQSIRDRLEEVIVGRLPDHERLREFV